MRVLIVLMALLASSCAAPPPERTGDPVELHGRTAGIAQRCVSLRPTDSLRASDTDPHTLIYGSGQVIWANRLGQCAFANDDILVTEPTGSYLCQGDLVRSFDRSSHIPGPSCVLGDFVAYRR